MAKGTLDRALNHLRASITHGRGRFALEEVRQYPRSNFRALLTCAYRVPNKGRNPLLAEAVRNPKWLLAYRTYSAIPLGAELEWTVCQLERWSKLLADYVKLRTALERAVLRDAWPTAIELMDRIEAISGQSSWLIVGKIATLQNAVGQESQKAYAREVIRTSAGLPVAIAHLASQRNEDAVSASGYLARANDMISGWSLSPEWDLYLRWGTLGKQIDDIEEIAPLLRVASSGSVIDLFEAFVVGAVFLSEDTTQSKQSDSLHLLQLLERVAAFGDPRIAYALSLFRSADGPDGRSQTATMVRELLTRARIDQCGQEGKFQRPLGAAIASMCSRDEHAETNRQNAIKLSLAFDFLPVGKAISSFVLAVGVPGVFPYSIAKAQVSHLLGDPGSGIWNDPFCDREPLLLEIESASKAGNFSGLSEAYTQLLAGDAFERVVAAKARFFAAGSTDKWWDAISIAVHCILEHPGARYEFPIAGILLSKDWTELKAHAEDVTLSIALAHALREEAAEVRRERLHRHLQQSALRVVRFHGFRTFSELAAIAHSDKALQYFLREVCSEPVMEVNTAIKSSRELSQERMKICQELAVLDENNASLYLDEIKQLTFNLEIEEGVRHFDSSRFFVNTDGLLKIGVSSLSEDFSRYVSLRKASLPDVSEIRAALITIQLKELEDPIPQVLLAQPKTEADRLLVEIVQRLARDFLHSPVHGLNSFLSLRIRHGSFAGHLRGPLEELGVAASRDEDGSYLPIERWDGLRAEMPSQDAAQFDQVFSTLSANIDSHLAWIVDELLQIRSETKPNGAFEDPVTLLLINVLKGMPDSVSLPELIETSLGHFKNSLEPRLVRIRHVVGEELKGKLDELLQEALVDIEVLGTDMHMSSVMDALGRARTSLALATDRVSQWFSPLDREATDRDYSVEQIVRMGEKLTTNARPTFVPQIDLKIVGELPLLRAQSGAFLIADALFIAFDNVYLHSGLESPIDVLVRVSVSKEGFISFRIENAVAEVVSAPELRVKLDRIRAQLQSGEFRKRVAGEGGTGLFKLRRLGESSAFEGRSNIDFGITDGRFFVDLLVPVVVKSVFQGESA